MKIKKGDIVEFVVLEWHEPQWEFDHPTVMLLPIVQYSPSTSAETMIEDLCIDLAIEADTIESPKEIESEDVYKEFEWRGWSLKRMITVAKNRLKGKEDWKSRYAKVIKQKVKFITEDNETSFTILKTIKK
jgi:hypothetical protein